MKTFLKYVYGYLKVFTYDTYRFIRYSGVLRKHTFAPSRGAQITKYYHMVEKGLALPSPRPGFGEQALRDLCAQVNSAIQDGVCRNEVNLAIDAISGYNRFNEGNGVPVSPWIAQTLKNAGDRRPDQTGAPVKSAAAYPKDPDRGLEFIGSRVSVRHFSGAQVPEEVLLKAARAAQAAPCVCNRQASRIYFLRDLEKKKAALSFQKGNRGFGDTAAVIAIITVDLAEMLEPTERYQHWIDGGLFAQNFLLGIHAQGYGACPLNWSSPISCDIGIRKLGYIPGSESIIMMVAVGGLVEDCKVARSERRPLQDVVKFP